MGDWMTSKQFFLAAALGLATTAMPVAGQVQTIVPAVVSNAKPDTVEHIKVHGKSLEGNLEGESADREVIVFLPPSYAKDKHRHYPVVYALHGYSIGAEQWTHEIHVPQTIEGAFAQGSKEMIVVLPDTKTLHNGSMYSSSVTTGDFEKFISHDLVVYIDAHYRTRADRLSRGLVGHSMGGYGATRIGMKHPDVFGSLYVLAKWTANAPLAFIDQYIDNLREYRAIGIDVGDQDGLRNDTSKLHEVLDQYGIANSFEIYHGTHISVVADRFQNHVMPFFSKNLCFQATCH